MEKKCRIIYDGEMDAYNLEILVDGEWTFCMACSCVTCEAHPEQGADYIHYSLITELKRYLDMGYEVVSG